MKFSATSTLKYTAFLIVAVALMYLAFINTDVQSLWNGLMQANWLWVIASLIVGLASHYVRSLRWKLLIEPLGYTPPTTNVFGALLIGYTANIAFPRIGEVARCASLRKTDKIPFESLFGTVIIERAFDVLTILILLIVVFFIKIDFFGNFFWQKVLMPLGNKILHLFDNAPVVLIGIVLFILFLAIFFKSKFLGEKLNRRLSNIYRGMLDGISSVFIMKERKLFIIYTILIWLLYWLMTWLLVFSIEPTSHLGPIDGFFLLVVGSFGMAAPVQGGFGAFHVIVAMALGIYGISWNDGLLYAIISHESQTMLVIVFGLIFMLYFTLIKKKRQELRNDK